MYSIMNKMADLWCFAGIFYQMTVFIFFQAYFSKMTWFIKFFQSHPNKIMQFLKFFRFNLAKWHYFYSISFKLDCRHKSNKEKGDRHLWIFCTPALIWWKWVLLRDLNIKVKVQKCDAIALLPNEIQAQGEFVTFHRM